MRRGVRLKGIKRVTKANGKTYVYRRVNGQLIPLPNLPENDPRFLQAYLEAENVLPKPKINAKPGSIDALIASFLGSPSFRSRKPSTQVVWRRILDQMRIAYGAALVRDIRTHHINKDLAKVSPGAARPRRTIWRALLSYAVETGELEANPAREASVASYETKPIPPWTLEEIGAFRDYWPIGSRERQAMEVIYWTGARCVDARNLGWQMVRDGLLEFVQQKTGGTAVVPIMVPTSPDLEPDRHMFLECAGKDLIWITTSTGRPRSQKGLSQFVSAAATKAGLPADRSAHGLRKSRAIALVHAGWTPHRIGAWTGHDSLKEVEDYTREVNKRALISGQNAKQQVIGFRNT